MHNFELCKRTEKQSFLKMAKKTSYCKKFRSSSHLINRLFTATSLETLKKNLPTGSNMTFRQKKEHFSIIKILKTNILPSNRLSFTKFSKAPKFL